MVECILARAGEKGLLAGDLDKWRILGCGVYFCWISDLMSVEKHMQSRLEPHPAQISPGLHSQEVLLPPFVALEGSVLYICKYEPWVSLNNYQLEILLMSSWATHPESNCELTISRPPLGTAASNQSLNTLVIADKGFDSHHSSRLLSGLSLAAESSWPLSLSCVCLSSAPTSFLFFRLQKAE